MGAQLAAGRSGETMIDSALRIVAWSLVALDALLWAGTLILDRSSTPGALLGVGPLLVFAGMGVLLVQQRPRNGLAWTFLILTTSNFAATFAQKYARLGLIVDPGSLPAAPAAGWLALWVDRPGWLLLFTFLPLLFPNGRLPSRAWRPVGWAAAVVIVSTTFWAGFGQVADPDFGWSNPLAQPALASFGPAADTVLGIGWVLLTPASIVSLALRFRRSHGVERQQLKWFFYAVALFPLTFLTYVGLKGTGSPLTEVASAAFGLAAAAMPLAIGIAVLRHNLFDIDLLINRTLVYGALTLTLGAGYVASILVLQAALSPVVQESALAVAASTLVAAALFQPARGRIQAIVDRRFYRSRYDAQRTLEAFSSRLRHEVDLDRLTDELRNAVGQTLQPASVSVWLRHQHLR